MQSESLEIVQGKTLGYYMKKRYIYATLALLVALIIAVAMSKSEQALAVLWFLGMAAGFSLQRSRFCFASAFRDLFLFGNSRIAKGIIVGLGIATIGFAIHMYNAVPFPAFGVLPQQAHILPVGLSTVVGGLMFGLGMVLAGGCVSGSLYRMAEGYIGSWITVVGIIIGLGLLAQSWNWWWTAVISHEPLIWLPARFNLGYWGGVAITLGGLLAAFLFLLWLESRSGLSNPQIVRQENPDHTLAQKLSILWRAVFVNGWSAAIGGAILGGIGVLMYMMHMPWGVTGELARLANITMTALHLPPPSALGMDDLAGCTGLGSDGGLFTHSFSVTVGLFNGALVGALYSGEFKLRFPRSVKRYIQSLSGGIIMGYGAGLAIGCTVGAFFSSIPSLSVSGWLFALALAGGAFLGVRLIKIIG